jgi:uncharacterized membrane protein
MTSGEAGDVRLCVLLACFAGDKGASKVHRAISKRLREDGDSIFDEVIVVVDHKGRLRLHYPRKVIPGALTPALTWGVFGLLTGGVQGLGVWAIVGAICGGLFSYYGLSRLGKDQRKDIGEHLPAGSSALAVSVKGSDPGRVLAAAAPSGPVMASVAAIGSDLSGRVLKSGDGLAGNGLAGASAGQEGTRAQATQLSMIMVRFAGQHAARQALAAAGPAKGSAPDAPQVEVVIEADERGKRRVIDPTRGPAAIARSDIVGWGAFGLVYGIIVGFAGNGGVLGPAERGLVTAIAWGAFGIFAGALFGLWTSRSVSVRRLKGIGPLVPPGSSVVVGWAASSVPAAAAGGWLAAGAQRLLVRFVAGEHGPVLDVPAPDVPA